jgi:hypothetical protein
MKIRSRSARRGGVFLAAIVGVTLLSTTTVFASHDFPDVPDSNGFHDDISWLVDAGVTEGFPDGTYRPGSPVTRGSMAAFIHRYHDAAEPALNDRNFHLHVQCAATTRFAVVNAVGTLARGSAGTSVAKLSTGTYEVIFNIDVTGCSYQATVGMPATSSTTGWANVAARAGNANGVFVSTWDHPAL